MLTIVKGRETIRNEKSIDVNSDKVYERRMDAALIKETNKQTKKEIKNITVTGTLREFRLYLNK